MVRRCAVVCRRRTALRTLDGAQLAGLSRRTSRPDRTRRVSRVIRESHRAQTSPNRIESSRDKPCQSGKLGQAAPHKHLVGKRGENMQLETLCSLSSFVSSKMWIFFCVEIFHHVNLHGFVSSPVISMQKQLHHKPTGATLPISRHYFNSVY